MKEGDIWLAKHFLESALDVCEQITNKTSSHKLEAEINCLLAFIARDNADNLGNNYNSKLCLSISYKIYILIIFQSKPWKMLWTIWSFAGL
jgi:hypothetical protein